MPKGIVYFVRTVLLIVGLWLCWMAASMAYHAYHHVGPAEVGVYAPQSLEPDPLAIHAKPPELIGTRTATEQEYKREQYIGASFTLLAGAAICYGALRGRLKPTGSARGR